MIGKLFFETLLLRHLGTEAVHAAAWHVARVGAPRKTLRGELARGARRLINKVLPHVGPPRVIYDRDGGSKYLSRYYILGGPRTKDAFDATGAPIAGVVWSKLPVNVYLHHFHRGDDDEALHNHPWSWSLSFILAGGYREERRDETRAHGANVVVRDVLPFSFNLILGEDFHRVDLLEEDAWSLFIAGPKASSWGFWDRYTDTFLPWREYIARRRGVPSNQVPW